MRHTRSRFRSRARAAWLWALAFFAAGQAALGVFVCRCHPEWCDPNFTFRLTRLRARVAEAPGRPLALVVGSSRAANGFDPASVTAGLGDAPAPVVHNFALLGCGPVRELMTLRRLRAEGVRPDWLIVEVWGPFMPQTGFFAEEPAFFAWPLHWTDVPLARRLFHRSWEAAGIVFEETVTPAVHSRNHLLYRYANFLLPRSAVSELAAGAMGWATLDERGWLPMGFKRPGPDRLPAVMQSAYDLTRPILDKFEVNPVSDKAMHELLDECRAGGTRVVLVLMPEHSALRGWYPPRARAAFHAWLSRLRADSRLPIIDARTWSPDEHFADHCHLMPDGARQFSARFGRDVMRPLLAGRLPAADFLLAEAPPP
jgi:hypothetical protein